MAINRKDLDAGGVDLADVAGGERIAPIHPGEILQEMVRSRNVTPYRVAKDAKMPLTRLTAILSPPAAGPSHASQFNNVLRN